MRGQKILKLLSYGSCTSVFLLALTLSDAEAQELLPLDQAIAAGANESYILIRCSSLFATIAKRAGRERMGAEQFDSVLAVSQQLFGVSSELYAKEAKVSQPVAIREDTIFSISFPATRRATSPRCRRSAFGSPNEH